MKNSFAKITLTFLILVTAYFSASANYTIMNKEINTISAEKLDTATFGAGCFWCVEAVFQRLQGVEKVQSGYANGQIQNPTYKEVCSGLTGYNEVCQITFDTEKISYAELLEVFWRTHDPTTLNRQGNDVGTQYRSGVYTHNDEQLRIAQKSKEAIVESGLFDDEVVTEIEPLLNYHAAEEYHQNYFNENSNQSYCTYVVSPKVEKFKKLFKDKLKEAK